MIRSRSIKIDDPAAHFSSWFFIIDPHHYWTLGMELKTFVTKKVPYQSWAYMTPPDYNFCQGYIFYSKTDRDHFLQVGVEQGLFDIEVFEGHQSEPDAAVSGWITTTEGLAHWLRTGTRPLPCREMDFSESKSGLMAWQLIKQTANAQ